MLDAKKIKSASIWSGLETASASLLGIVSILFLAQLLTPEQYGKIATAQFISGLIQIILSLGLNELIIQKKDLNENHIQTFWVTTIFLGVCSFIFCIFISYILYKNNYITISKILVFEGGISFFSLLSIVPTAIMMRNLNMKSFAIRNIFSRIIFFAFSIPLAMNGFGLWSIVFSNFIQVLVSFILIYIETRKTIPKKINFDIKILRKEIGFGYYVMVENLLWSFLSKILGLLIALFHGAAELGLYNMATKLTDTILGILNTGITRLTLPIFSSNQSSKENLLHVFQASTYYFNILSMPIFLFMALTAEFWVPIILGEKWKAIIVLVQIISVMYAVMNSRIFVGIAVKAIGKPKEFLKLSAFAAFITVICLTLTKNLSLSNSIIILATCRIVFTIPLGVYLMKKICGFSTYEQFFPLFKPILISSIIILLCELIRFLFPLGDNLIFVSQIFVNLGVFSFIFYVLFKTNSLKWK